MLLKLPANSRKVCVNATTPTARAQLRHDRKLCWKGKVSSRCAPLRQNFLIIKLTFQWSEPVFLVTSVTPSVVTVRNLANKEGVKVSVVKSRTDTVVNKKMTSLYPVPISFFLGAQGREEVWISMVHRHGGFGGYGRRGNLMACHLWWFRWRADDPGRAKPGYMLPSASTLGRV